MTAAAWDLTVAFVLAVMAPMAVADQPAVRSAVTVQIAPPPPASTAAAGHCAEWADLAFSVGWPAEQWPILSRVMWCESQCQPSAWNRSGASGLMQVLASWFAAGEDPFDAGTNLTVALRVWERQGWPAWSCF